MIQLPQTQRSDEQRVDSIVTAIRAKYPTAASFEVSSSDQGGGGYLLYSVRFPDGSIVDSDSGEFTALVEELWEDLIWLRWGAFGDGNMDSGFDVDMTTRQIIR